MDEPEARVRVGFAAADPAISRTPRLVIGPSDEHRWVTLSALVGLVGALVLGLFGIPSIDMHGPLHQLGIMDPLCGGTRSWYLLLHGRPWDALRYNPAGPLLLAIALAALIRGAVGVRTGRWVNLTINRRVHLPVLLIAVVALEVNQQLNASLLMERWGD
ncbi:DUF2752 domain-containing protein [Nocardia salmonicida]|uniref:DUF2752 domain-containing protein n=1 Tax=Nocardia salmonicida TaxID=53431 RepID=UPI0033DE76F7